GHAVMRHIDRGAVDVRGHQLEGLLLRAHFLEVHRRDSAVLAEETLAGRIDEVDADQPRGVREREPSQHDAVHDAERGGDAADAERQDDDRHRAEALLPQENSKTNTEILDDVSHLFALPGRSYDGRSTFVPQNS